MHSSRPLSALGAVVALIALAGTAMAYTGQNLEGGARIGISEARALALKVQPGTVADQELEKEPGGSGLRYSFDIKVDTGTYEVGVDAVTGAVLENHLEGPNAD